jgi:hypothetical protein
MCACSKFARMSRSMKAPAQTSEWLFSYGTLQDPAVVASSVLTHHKIFQPSSRVKDEVEGMVYQRTMDQLAAADRYQVSEYKRAPVTLKSGLRAWA